MKVVIISGFHASLEALAVLPREYDQLWVLGDLVNYGPNPAEVVEFVPSRAKHVVRGNHDQFVGYDSDLISEEEWQAPRQALTLLAGHRNVEPDTLKKRR